MSLTLIKPVSCQHERFDADAVCVKIEDLGRYMCEVRVRCAECQSPFRFSGLPLGASLDRAMMSPDGLEARIPMGPAI